MPEVRLDPEQAWRAAHGGAVALGGAVAHGAVAGDAGAEGAVVRLTDADGLIALAQARPGGLLAPIVGLRG